MTNDINPPKNNGKEIFGWATYAWANHAFFTLVLGVLVGEYLTGLAQSTVGENGPVITIGGHVLVTAKSLFSYSVGTSVFLQIFVLPLLGAIADYTHLKKAFLAFFCVFGAFCCSLLFFIKDDLFLLGSGFFILANLSIGASQVFYNSYLIDISTEDRRDKVSSWGFAAGYGGGFVTLIISAILIFNAEKLGTTSAVIARFCFLGAGIWWAGFSVIAFVLLKQRAPIRTAPEGTNFLLAGFVELKGTFGELFRLKHTTHFLIAYLLYNDGIQTVITMSAIFFSQELFVSKGLETDRTVLLVAFMIAQFVAFIGSLAFERVAHFTSTKSAILISLIIWCGLIVYAYLFFHTVTEAYVLSGAIGFVLGGSQALSRSLFSQMIPKGRESAFFGLYAISEGGTSWLGPIVFGLVAQLTDSYRPAILALAAFFIVGSILLFFTNTKQAIHDAGNVVPDAAPAA
ncbi:MAG: MFS transporter [Acidobacteriota bacterium]